MKKYEQLKLVITFFQEDVVRTSDISDDEENFVYGTNVFGD